MSHFKLFGIECIKRLWCFQVGRRGRHVAYVVSLVEEESASGYHESLSWPVLQNKHLLDIVVNQRHHGHSCKVFMIRYTVILDFSNFLIVFWCRFGKGIHRGEKPRKWEKRNWYLWEWWVTDTMCFNLKMFCSLVYFTLQPLRSVSRTK